MRGTKVLAAKPGATRSLIGAVVTVEEVAANGRSCRVMFEPEHDRYSRHGSWLVTAWLDIEREEAAPLRRVLLKRQRRMPV